MPTLEAEDERPPPTVSWRCFLFSRAEPAKQRCGFAALAAIDRIAERGRALFIDTLEIGAMLDQEFDQAKVGVLGGIVERRFAIVSAREIDRDAVGEEQGHNIQ